jgi:hypothetical protein
VRCRAAKHIAPRSRLRRRSEGTGSDTGRKNHYGSKSQRGTEVAALFYSLLESAKLAGVDPAAYLAEATRRAIANPGTVTLPTDLG